MIDQLRKEVRVEVCNDGHPSRAPNDGIDRDNSVIYSPSPISIKYQHIPRTRISIAPISALFGLVDNQSR